MEGAEQMLYALLDELAERSMRMSDRVTGLASHAGHADRLVNIPCRERALLSSFRHAPSYMLDEIKGLDHYETQTDKLSRKLRQNPFFGIGVLAMAGVCAAGALRLRGGLVTLPTPQYLMQLRVAAQSACVGSVVAGAAYASLQHHHHSDV